MFSSFNDAVFDHVSSTVPAGAPVARGRLAQSDVPRPIGHFLQNMLERRVAVLVDGLGGVAEGWVDHRASEVVDGRRAFERVLVENAQFPVDEWPRALRQAVERVTAHLVRPVPTTVQFLFGDETSPVSREDLIRRSRYFVAYPYLQTTVEALLERTGSGPMERRELSEALERVERSVASEWSTDDWLRALGPLTELASAAGLDGVPLVMLDAFFEAKDAPLMAGRVQAYGRRNGLDRLGRDQLRSALADVTAEKAAESDRPSGGPAGVPLWQQFRPGAETAPTERPPAASSEPLWKRFREPVGNGEPTSLSVVERDVLGEVAHRRDTFVRELFAGSEEEYGRLLGRLRAATTWAAASRILGEDLFRKHKIDIYSPAAVDFTNAVEDRYRRDA